MALGDLKIRIGIDATGIEKGLRNAQKKLEKSASRFAAIGSNISMGISAPLGLLGAQAINTAAEFETLETGLSVLTGSAEAGAKAFERLKEFSAATPFQLNDLVSANNTMMGFGLSADEAFNSLNQLGDIAAVMGSDLNSLSVAFGQSAASGVAMTADINQFINQGIPMYKLLEKVTNKNTKELKDMASKSEITFELIQKALKQATEEGGMFFEGMKQGSKTIGGVLSTFKDKMSLAMGTLGRSISEAINFKEVMQKLGDTINSVTNWFAGLSDTTKKTIIGVVGLVAALGPLMFALGSLASVGASLASGFGVLNDAAKLLKNPYVALAAAVVAVTLAIRNLIRAKDKFKRISENIHKTVEKNAMSYVKEKKKAQELIKPINNLMLSTDKRKQALLKLQKEYPGYFKNLKVEEGKVLDVTAAYDELVKSLKESARQRAISSMLEELQGRMLDIEMDLGMSFEGKEFEEIRKEVRKLGQDAFKDFGSRFKSNLKEMLTDTGLGEFRDDWQKAQDKVQEYMILQEEMNKLMQQVDPSKIQETYQELNNAGSGAGKATEKTKNYREELEELFNLYDDKLINGGQAYAQALSIVRGEMEKLSKSRGKNIFGETADDLQDLRVKLEGMVREMATLPDAGGPIIEGFLKDIQDKAKDADLPIEPKTVEIKPREIKFEKGLKADDLNSLFDHFDIGGSLLGKFNELFASIANNEYLNDLGENLKAGIMLGVGALDIFSKSFDQKMQAQQSILDKNHNAEIERIEASTASEEVKQARKAIAEKIYEKKSRAIKRKQAQREKMMAMFEATVHMAAGIIQAFPNLPLMALGAALGAAQIATIAATPIPMAKGGILTGPTNILAGEYMGARNNPEIIAPLDKLKNLIGGQTNINLQGAFRLTGNDLILAVEQANKNRIRQGGQSIF